MIKRPINHRFHGAVLADRKTTTIRDKPWPVGVPIMLYAWSGAAYRSKQLDITPVVVLETTEIEINRTIWGVGYWKKGTSDFMNLWIGEGFESQKDMDAWFLEIVKPGQTLKKHLMRFRRSNHRISHTEK